MLAAKATPQNAGRVPSLLSRELSRGLLQLLAQARADLGTLGRAAGVKSPNATPWGSFTSADVFEPLRHMQTDPHLSQ
jgi:hypothetical protein